METKTFLDSYRLSLGRNGLPVELHRTPLGTTYRAQEIESGREVAIELIPASSLDPAVVESLQEEAGALRQINHLNIPLLQDFAIEGEQLVYVTEYFDGPTAQAWVAARGPLTPGAVLRIALQVVGALGAASFRRLSHPALNPANIIFIPEQADKGDGPAIKLLHWSGAPIALARRRTSGEDEFDSPMPYQSPEQRRGERVDFASAIYSLGATMWFLLSGEAPAPAPDFAVDKASRLGGEKSRALPKIMRHLLDRMLRFDPAERPLDPVALTAYLQTCLARVERRKKVEPLSGVAPVTSRRVEDRKPWPNKLEALALAGVLLALAASAALLRWPPRGGGSSPIAQEIHPVISRQPNETPVVWRDSLGRLPDRDQPTAATPTAVVPQTRTPPNQMPAESVVAESTVAEPAPPAAGPTESTECYDHPTIADAPASRLADGEVGITDQPAVFAETSEPPSIASAPAPQTYLPASGQEREATGANGPSVSSERVATKARSTSKKSGSLAKRSRGRSQTRRPRLAHTAKRAKPLPKLRVGTAPAELVGTTSDGRWILSVADSGRRIIVSPPPGYAR